MRKGKMVTDNDLQRIPKSIDGIVRFNPSKLEWSPNLGDDSNLLYIVKEIRTLGVDQYYMQIGSSQSGYKSISKRLYDVMQEEIGK